MTRKAAPVRSIPRRYQLTKEAVGVVRRGHPWIFRSHLSSAASVLADGQWLVLVDGANQIVAHGVYQAAGAIAIRILARGADRPRGAAIARKVDAALGKRAELRARTDAFRAIHGESDGMPAVVVEVLGPVVVASAYAAGVGGLARFAARRLAAATAATGVLLRAAHRRAEQPEVPRRAPPPAALARDERDDHRARVLRGAVPAAITIHEDGVPYVIDPHAGQKGGAYLDLRGLRRAIAARDLAGARVLNLFAYTGMLGRAAERAGAASIVHVDSSAAALAHAARHHTDDPARHTHVTADVFRWIQDRPAGEQHDVVIVDPPAMTSRADQVGRVLAAYRALFARAAALVAPGGLLVTACCTSRVPREAFVTTATAAVGPRFTLDADLPPEPDHPVGFPEADYLKVLLWRSATHT
jgi:23S rRNA (cytosine1962-C5)-methyltransferase